VVFLLIVLPFRNTAYEWLAAITQSQICNT